ncbi:hypothetical protein C8R45DRAFT_1186245 [Mycena sanguinolenta]|nr:hypothetical protein C8R45DRAFT_1186245 [Mycena sanguinolenta]
MTFTSMRIFTAFLSLSTRLISRPSLRIQMGEVITMMVYSFNSGTSACRRIQDDRPQIQPKTRMMNSSEDLDSKELSSTTTRVLLCCLGVAANALYYAVGLSWMVDVGPRCYHGRENTESEHSIAHLTAGTSVLVHLLLCPVFERCGSATRSSQGPAAICISITVHIAAQGYRYPSMLCRVDSRSYWCLRRTLYLSHIATSALRAARTWICRDVVTKKDPNSVCVMKFTMGPPPVPPAPPVPPSPPRPPVPPGQMKPGDEGGTKGGGGLVAVMGKLAHSVSFGQLD